MKIKGIGFNKISKKIWAFLVFFAKHIVLSCFLVVLISICAGLFIFYTDIILANQKSIDNMGSTLDIKKSYFDRIIKIWNDENERNANADSKTYENIFYSLPQPAVEKPKPSPTSVKPSPIPESPKPSPEQTPQ